MFKTTQIMKEETHCCHFVGYSYHLTAMDMYVCIYYINVPANNTVLSHRLYSTDHSLCCTSCGAVVGTRNSSTDSVMGIKLTAHCTLNDCYTTKLCPIHVHH